jgi:ubiquinone/menaquinone biosynthesis C-methylase UbiE
MDRHGKTVQEEFTRQAEAFARAPELRAADVTQRIADVLAELRPDRVLDLACGPGVLARLLSEHARVVVGADLTDAVLRVARRGTGDARNVGFVRSLAERTPFRTGAFDAVVLRLALHHFARPADQLAEVRRLLRPGGRLVVLDIVTSPDAETAMLHNAIETLRDPSHARFVPMATLQAGLRDAGFAVLSESSWRTPRDFAGWASIVSEPARMASLEVVLRRLAAAGEGAGIDLREEDGALRFTYTFGLLVAAPG